MEKEITLPAISEGQESGEVLEIYVSEGDEVKEEQSLLSAEADKANVDVPAEIGGKVQKIEVSEGDEVKVGDVLVVLESQDDEGRSDESSKNAGESRDSEKEEKAGEKPEASESDKDKKKQKEKSQDQEESDGSSKNAKNDANVPAAPLARKFARELGIDIQELAGNDPEDRITREDVFAHAKRLIENRSSRNEKGTSKAPQQSIKLPDFSQWGEIHREPMDGVRRTIADNTTASWQNVPHVTQFDEADITELQRYLDRKNEKGEEKLTITSVVIKLAAMALKRNPKFNASLNIANKEIIYKEYVNIGIAAATDRGLLVPVVRDADQKSISGLSQELNELVARARDGKLSKEEMEGGTFVISNQGPIGGTQFTPVVFPPQTAILGMSRAHIKPVYDQEKEEFVPRLILPLALSYDHRMLDGAEAAGFVDWLCKSLSTPVEALI
jgi:pyruvate dehydrogenase E2 component (dihydrolipoamide acetyltransferase)